MPDEQNDPVKTWNGTPVEECSKEELLTLVQHQGRKLQELRRRLDILHRAINAFLVSVEKA